MLRAAFRLGALCAIAGCSAPAIAPREGIAPEAAVEPDVSGLEREAEPRESKARSLAQLAATLHDRGHLEEAEHFYRRALAVEFAEGSADADFRARTLAGLGSLLGERAAAAAGLGRTRDAEGLYREALEIWETLQPGSDALVAESLANLALLHRARGEHEKARALLERALPLYEKTLPADDPTVARVRALIASSAAPRAPEPDPAAVARGLDREGAAYLDRRDFAHARPLLERAVAIHERGVTAPVELGASLSYLGRTYAGLGERDSARRTLERSLALLEPVLGNLDPLTLATRASLEHVRGSVPADTP